MILRIFFFSFFVLHISLGSQNTVKIIKKQCLPAQLIAMCLKGLPVDERIRYAKRLSNKLNQSWQFKPLLKERKKYITEKVAPLFYSPTATFTVRDLKEFSSFIDNPKNPNSQYAKVKRGWDFVHAFNEDKTIEIDILDKYTDKKEKETAPKQALLNAKQALLNKINEVRKREKGRKFCKNIGEKQYYLVLRAQNDKIFIDLLHMPPEYSLYRMCKRFTLFPDLPQEIAGKSTDFLEAILSWDFKTIDPNSFSYTDPTDPGVLALCKFLKPVNLFDCVLVRRQITENRGCIAHAFLEMMIELLKARYPDVKAIKFNGTLYGPGDTNEILKITTPRRMLGCWIEFEMLNRCGNQSKTIFVPPEEVFRRFLKEKCIKHWKGETDVNREMEQWNKWVFWGNIQRSAISAWKIKDGQIGKKRTRDSEQWDYEKTLTKVPKIEK